MFWFVNQSSIQLRIVLIDQISHFHYDKALYEEEVNILFTKGLDLTYGKLLGDAISCTMWDSG